MQKREIALTSSILYGSCSFDLSYYDLTSARLLVRVKRKRNTRDGGNNVADADARYKVKKKLELPTIFMFVAI